MLSVIIIIAVIFLYSDGGNGGGMRGDLIRLLKFWTLYRGGSRAAATFKMECFLIIVNGYS